MAYRDDVLALSPLVYWRLGETSGSTAEDESGNNIDGTYSGVTLNASSCLTGDSDPSAQFDGDADSKVEAGSVSGLPDGATDPWSIVLWHRTSDLVSLAAYFGFGEQPDGSTTEGAKRCLLCFNGHYYIWGENRDWDTGVDFDDDDQPHMVAITFSGTHLRLYVDGTLAAGPQAAPGYNTAGAYVTAGSHHPSGDSPNADIDECAIFDFELDSTEIADLYTSGTTGGGGGGNRRRRSIICGAAA